MLHAMQCSSCLRAATLVPDVASHTTPGEIADTMPDATLQTLPALLAYGCQPGCIIPSSSLVMQNCNEHFPWPPELYPCSGAFSSSVPIIPGQEAQGTEPSFHPDAESPDLTSLWSHRTPAAHCPWPAAPHSHRQPCCRGRSTSWSGHHGCFKDGDRFKPGPFLWQPQQLPLPCAAACQRLCAASQGRARSRGGEAERGDIITPRYL